VNQQNVILPSGTAKIGSLEYPILIKRQPRRGPRVTIFCQEGQRAMV